MEDLRCSQINNEVANHLIKVVRGSYASYGRSGMDVVDLARVYMYVLYMTMLLPGLASFCDANSPFVNESNNF